VEICVVSMFRIEGLGPNVTQVRLHVLAIHR